ncbi:MAG: phosphoribosylanthranilate isomerase [Lewinellaceae bacterium]|nr:phosphoribosylanthranilate isomerase [Lewinellaceae bacterium]
MPIAIKICCIANWDEASLAISTGATILGLVGPMPSGPGVISDTTIAAIAERVPPGIETFLLSSETTAEGLIDHHNRTRTTAIQLVDTVPVDTLKQLRKHLPGVKLVQVIHVQNQQSIEEALTVTPWVDGLLLDSGNPTLTVKELGGTGRTHDWAISREIVTRSSVPVFLAGGLNAGNVRKAMQQVAPYGLDICSGVRTQGRLDPQKLEEFIQAANQ